MAKEKITKKVAKAHLDKKAKSVSEEDVTKVLEKKKELEAKYVGVPGEFAKLINQVKLLFEMIGDYWSGDYKEVPFATIAMAVAAVAYFLSPIDLIPDFIPVLGYVDDALVVMLAISALESDLKDYCKFKGYDQVKYF